MSISKFSEMTLRLGQPSGDGPYVILLDVAPWGGSWNGQWNDDSMDKANERYPATCYISRGKFISLRKTRTKI